MRVKQVSPYLGKRVIDSEYGAGTIDDDWGGDVRVKLDRRKRGKKFLLISKEALEQNKEELPANIERNHHECPQKKTNETTTRPA